MSGIAQLKFEDAHARVKARDQLVVRRASNDPLWMKAGILSLTIGFLVIFFVLPLVLIFREAVRKGVGEFSQVFADRATRHSIWLTLEVAAIAVPLNTIFGLAAAWV